jgi:hypothetical protein
MPFREIIATDAKNHSIAMNTHCRQNAEFLNVKLGGTHRHHRDLNGYLLQVSRRSE